MKKLLLLFVFALLLISCEKEDTSAILYLYHTELNASFSGRVRLDAIQRDGTIIKVGKPYYFTNLQRGTANNPDGAAVFHLAPKTYEVAIDGFGAVVSVRLQKNEPTWINLSDYID